MRLPLDWPAVVQVAIDLLRLSAQGVLLLAIAGNQKRRPANTRPLQRYSFVNEERSPANLVTVRQPAKDPRSPPGHYPQAGGVASVQSLVTSAAHSEIPSRALPSSADGRREWLAVGGMSTGIRKVLAGQGTVADRHCLFVRQRRS